MRRFSVLPVKAQTLKEYIRASFMVREAAAEETVPAAEAATRI